MKFIPNPSFIFQIEKVKFIRIKEKLERLKKRKIFQADTARRRILSFPQPPFFCDFVNDILK